MSNNAYSKPASKLFWDSDSDLLHPRGSLFFTFESTNSIKTHIGAIYMNIKYSLLISYYYSMIFEN